MVWREPHPLASLSDWGAQTKQKTQTENTEMDGNKMTDKNEERLLTCDEVGHIIGCTGRYVREVLVRQRGMKAVVLCRNKQRNRLAFRRGDVDDWCAKNAHTRI